MRGMTHDGLGKYLKEKITKAEGSTVDIAQVLKDTRTDVVVSYLPVGSEQATKWYVEQILEAGCAFVNCIPVFIAREDYWNARFKKAGLPIVGDDIKSQVGATIVHRSLARLFGDRGVKLMRTSQLNVGGNMDFYNMLERERLESKKISKTNAVTSIVEHDMEPDDVHVGPSDYVPWLTDRKWAHIRLEGQAFGDVPLIAELKLEVWDSPNSAGIVIDAVRCCKLGAQPRHRRPARRPELLPHEVALHPAPGPPGARGDRGLHRPPRPHPRRGRAGPRGGGARGHREVGGHGLGIAVPAARSCGPPRAPPSGRGAGPPRRRRPPRRGPPRAARRRQRGDGERRGERVAGAGGVDLLDLRRRDALAAQPGARRAERGADDRARRPVGRPSASSSPSDGSRTAARAAIARTRSAIGAPARMLGSSEIRPPAAWTRATAASTTAAIDSLSASEEPETCSQAARSGRSPRSASVSAPAAAPATWKTNSRPPAPS